MNKLIIMMILAICVSTGALADTTPTPQSLACKKLFQDKFSQIVLSVNICNVNLFSPDVYIIEYLDDQGQRNYRQCIVGGGYVRIPSAFQKWEC